jgi:predicted nucleic acid-binding protein
MSGKAVLDANVLYSARLRDLWMELAVSGLVGIAWTDRIEAEWINAVVRKRPSLEPHMRKTAAVMRRVLPEARVKVGPRDTPAVTLPDPDDLHVVAAAVVSSAKAIVTFNVDDFPAPVLKALDIEVMTPDAYLLRIAREDAEGLLTAVATVRARLRAPVVDASTYAAGLARAGCPKLAAWLGARLKHF